MPRPVQFAAPAFSLCRCLFLPAQPTAERGDAGAEQQQARGLGRRRLDRVRRTADGAVDIAVPHEGLRRGAQTTEARAVTAGA